MSAKNDENKGGGYITVNSFNEHASYNFRNQFFKMEASDQAIIPIVIDSFGGDVYSLLSMVAIIESSNKPVATICDSKAMSCGAMLFSCGNKGLRFFGPRAYMLIHQISSETYGKFTDIMVSTEHTSRLNDEVFKLLDKNSGKKKGYFERMLFDSANSDLYFDADAVIKHGLADHVSIPRLSIEHTITSNLLHYGKKAPQKITKSVKKLK